MRVDPAVATAGSEVLPAHIVAFRDRITITEPTEGLESDDLINVNYHRYFMLVGLDQYGDVYIRSLYVDGPTGLSRETWLPQIHVIRTTGSNDSQSLNEMAVEWERNPWRQYRWFRDNFRRWAEMMPAPSDTVAGRLAYFQTPAKRLRNIRTPIKAGRWLNKYFGDILSQEEIQKYGLEWESAFGPTEVTITQDSDEIQEVYQAAHLGSCMWFPAGDWEGSCHPARVYGGSLDLGIAYIGTPDEPVGRCLVWPKKMVYLDKMYGDDYRLRNALKHLGYREANDYDFDGARLLRIPHGRAFVLPYIDTHSRVRDNGEYLILDDSGSIGCQSSEHTEGLSVRHEPYSHCYDCGDEIEDSNDATYIPRRGDACEGCRNDNHFYCEVSDDYHRDEDMAETPEGWTAARSAVENSSRWFYCDITEMHYPRGEYTRVELVEGQWCEEHHAESNGFFCAAHEKYSLNSLKQVELSDGSSVHLDYFDGQAELDAFLAERELSIVVSPTSQLFEAA